MKSSFLEIVCRKTKQWQVSKSTRSVLVVGIAVSTVFAASVTMVSCKKQNEFLREVPNDALVIPRSLGDLQKLLQNDAIFNQTNPGIGQASTDEFYVSDFDFIDNPGLDQNVYIWAKDIYPATQRINDWNYPYAEIYNANVILDALEVINISPSDISQANAVKGSALFFRALSHYNLLQHFAKQYDSATAQTDLGVPLRLTADLVKKSTRATVQQCYDQVINDLVEAIQLLPIEAVNIEMPSIFAAQALLARVYLTMGRFDSAFVYANLVLAKKNSLFDYNNLLPDPTRLTSGSQFPLPEMLYLTTMVNYYFNFRTVAAVDSVLYNSYGSNDLRKTSFFYESSDVPRFKGNYQLLKPGYLFDGVAIDELFLIRAEIYARRGDYSSAMNDLNTLLEKRWKAGTFVKFTAVDADEALKLVLLERKKELFFRGVRWTDLRRLNKDPRFAVTLTRKINGQVYTLPPNDPRYTFAIPDQEIQISGLEQNPR
ncbi:RagB/SusD family nutrient uptake outer membrane protein [Chitinophaga tropicalis]|uniref:RagB/SusD family nutrient uptake outer membrane protein n=1 Tax=Chitinophaga tropicalis TaxID=2683588 RepID=A0A7K1TZY9_9BACT|nr:RagB/SusD family nutrient uptake outer membrane protein [Chitinophaga tropicalis]MVT07663.1 RagB/SusD family nutrient uptake outer membrane protein [Chitinophaga tropicalis]